MTMKRKRINFSYILLDYIILCNCETLLTLHFLINISLNVLLFIPVSCIQVCITTPHYNVVLKYKICILSYVYFVLR